ncbi:MAG: hypothetical protein ACK5MJ_06030 [Alphaproteobacteria bacterium]
MMRFSKEELEMINYNPKRTSAEKEMLKIYRKIPHDDFEAQYRFLKSDEAVEGEALNMLLHIFIHTAPVEERIRIEEKLEAEGLL